METPTTRSGVLLCGPSDGTASGSRLAGAQSANVKATGQPLDATQAKRVGRILYSTSACGGTPTFPRVEAAELLPRSTYLAGTLATRWHSL